MAPEDPAEDGAPESDDSSSGPPPNPLDRPWVHPSELRSFTTTPVAPPREPRPKEWVIGLSSAVGGIVATVLVLVAFGALGGRHRSVLPPPVVTTPNDIVDYAVAERVGSAVAPSVVTVRAGAGANAHQVGSGVVLASDRVVTAAHNLAGATDVSVVTNVGTELAAKVVGVDPQTDLAFLSVSAAGLQLAQFGSSRSRVGQTVVAVTPSRGGHVRVNINVVSDRDAMVDTGTGIDVAGLLETDIAVTPDMSGGALVDPSGNLVGVLTRPAAAGGPAGLAVPVGAVRDVQDQLDGSGKVAHGWIGVTCDPNPAPNRPQGGALVAGVLPGSPAAQAGLAPGDVVIRAGGALVTGLPDLVAAVRSLRPEDSLGLDIVRDGRARSLTVTVKAGDPQMLGGAPAMG